MRRCAVRPPSFWGTSNRSTYAVSIGDKGEIMAEFSSAQVKYLESQRLGRLATLRPDGTLQNNPVGFTFLAETGTIKIGGLNFGDSQKYKNVVANGQVAFVVDDLASVDPWRPRMIEVRGTAEPVRGEDSRGSTIVIHPKRVISFGIEE